MTHHWHVHGSHEVTTTKKQALEEAATLMDACKLFATSAALDEIVPGAWETDGGRVESAAPCFGPAGAPLNAAGRTWGDPTEPTPAVGLM